MGTKICKSSRYYNGLQDTDIPFQLIFAWFINLAVDKKSVVVFYHDLGKPYKFNKRFFQLNYEFGKRLAHNIYFAYERKLDRATVIYHYLCVEIFMAYNFNMQKISFCYCLFI